MRRSLTYGARRLEHFPSVVRVKSSSSRKTASVLCISCGDGFANEFFGLMLFVSIKLRSKMQQTSVPCRYHLWGKSTSPPPK
ncbi:hypothetical protein CJF30_00005315 [Rutstroemia sp. NJR-2017a BBW]|nr:hypothetical protein CJF30_00005315 [Rutstroemia sp. NJR-2017a BBW]